MTTVSRRLDRRRSTFNSGSAAVEFAFTAPLLVLLALGAADYGTMMAQSSSLAAYARAGAEYAASQVASGAGMPSSATIKTTLNFPAAVIVTAPAPSCTCADGTSVTCPGIADANPCVAKSDPRVLESVSISTMQGFSPMVSYAEFTPFPSSLSSTTVLRVK
jgi:Flp pilus assembly protein TadG